MGKCVSQICYHDANGEREVIMRYPKIGIRPVIDGRWGGVRESLENVGKPTQPIYRAMPGYYGVSRDAKAGR